MRHLKVTYLKPPSEPGAGSALLLSGTQKNQETKRNGRELK